MKKRSPTGEYEFGEGQPASLDEIAQTEKEADKAIQIRAAAAQQKKVFNITAKTIGVSLGGVLGSAIGFYVPFVIVLIISNLGGDSAFSISALIVGAIGAVAGLFMGAAAGYLTAENSAGHFFKDKEKKR